MYIRTLADIHQYHSGVTEICDVTSGAILMALATDRGVAHFMFFGGFPEIRDCLPS